jgi:23S rRNA pseudouridine2604 synthase
MEKIRLSKLMSERGICSRREADSYIERGLVFVDGLRVSELGIKVDPSAGITLDEKATAEQTGLVTIILNKPVGYVSGQAERGYKPASVLLTAANRAKGDPSKIKFSPSHLKNLAPAGRLDIDSQGLIVFTQDGRVAKRLVGEKSDVEKEYVVRVEGILTVQGLKLLNHGLSLDGAPLKKAAVTLLNEDQLKFILKQGKKRQIRRMCEQVGLKVTGLKRVRIGNVMLANLPEGKWRYLGPGEEF